MAVDIEWGDNKGGSISVDKGGLWVGTECCGCGSTQLTDVDKLTQLRDALNEILEEKGRIV